MAERTIVCIGCPKGCEIHVKYEGHEVIEMTGNTCKRGEDYVRNEITHPLRMVTSIVPVEGSEFKTVPVKTRSDVPKERIFDVMRELVRVKAKAPVKMGDVILENVAGTGIDIVATRSV
ncbi:MAG: DUF1667 domain-containing protein [Lachnospiraceae bacterium]|nr:DUF1667 domain-containing protein [Lachnospiraceae bacterium]MBQ9580350.1 DUF1667 domain-containing protein [Lachnospiraceae bacterium]MBR0434806.1 DUF1667 domain-containing protein [Lachnospiraceae bacterium]